MKARLIPIGNSKGIRLPTRLPELYTLGFGDEVEIEERQEGIMLRPLPSVPGKLSWEAAYTEMAQEAAERTEWRAWDELAGDGLTD